MAIYLSINYVQVIERRQKEIQGTLGPKCFPDLLKSIRVYNKYVCIILYIYTLNGIIEKPAPSTPLFELKSILPTSPEGEIM